MAVVTIDKPINLVAYDPVWPQYFEQECARLCAALGLGVTAIEHIGSTAVAGLVAKPILDIMVGVKGFGPSPSMTEDLMRLGYEALGEAGVPSRLYFRHRGAISYNVHIVEREGAHWTSNLALRDYLRAHPAEAARYGEAKVTIVGSGASSLLQYSEAKAEVVRELVERGRVWRAAT